MIFDKSGVSVSSKLARELRTAIVHGFYAPGSQFPPVRSLAVTFGVNPNTVQKVLTALEEEGLLVSRGTVGRFVTEDTATIDAARYTMQQEYMQAALAEAKAIGISKEQFLRYLEESEEIT